MEVHILLYTKNIEKTESYDVVVCGGGFTGFAAAYSAAREGARVLLVEKGSCLGGVGTAGLVNDILGQRIKIDGKLTNSVAGVYCELERRLLDSGHAVDSNKVDHSLHPHGWLPGLATGLIYDNEYMKNLLETMLREVGVTLLYYTSVIDTVTSDGRVEGVVIHNKDGLSYITASVFVDATGDGDICAMSGCGFELGDEEGGLAAASLEMHVDNVDSKALWDYMETTRDLRFRKIIGELKEAGIWKFPYEIFISVKMCDGDVYMINTIRQVGINGVDTRSMTDGTVDGRAENMALLDIMRAHFPGFANAKIRQIAPVIGIRETRRIKGEYTLTVQDLVDSTVFDDSIAVSCYGWDLPHPKHPSLQPSHGVKRRTPYAHIPYRCLLPIGVDNLIMAGRCISVEREVLGPVRVMGPCIAMGECAGIAAKMAVDSRCAFREVDVTTLQERIRYYGGITHME